ncbi:MAG TPA: hypothetical protein VGQ14_02025 [Candidatus Eisenbacteria bacterium]|nr:hypothetical protein [Candidatus Eisenbacteria bacterium]
MSTGIPQAEISQRGPLSRADFLALLYWFADSHAVPEVIGIRGLSRVTRLAAILGDETGMSREIDPFFTFHATPDGGIASTDLWTELLALRDYQVLETLPADEGMPSEEIAERRYLLENHIPAPEHRHYPIPTWFERDVLTNKGTFFAAKREDQTIERRVRIFQTLPELNRLPLDELTARALPLIRVPATR